MPFTATELANIANAALDKFVGKGEVYKQAIQNKPLIAVMDRGSGTFSGGKGDLSIRIKPGQGGLALSGYTHDDVVTYGNPATIKTIKFPWKEHHIGMGLTHTELKHDGITVVENGANQRTSEKDGREEHALANLLDEKIDEMNEDYAVGWNALLWGDGSSDAKALAGLRSFILDNPASGSTGGLNRTTNVWWRNRAATAAANAAGTGANAITSSTSAGGALLQFLQKEQRQLDRYGSRRSYKIAGSDFINAMEIELRANGQYAQTGWKGGDGTIDGAMQQVAWNGLKIVYDPTLDDLGLAKRMYDIDLRNIKLMYMAGEKMKQANPARPYDRYVMYRAMTTTAVMCTKKLNTSGVYDIA